MTAVTTEHFVQSDPEMFYTPVHEAGHALMCFLLRLDFGRVSIVPHDNSVGRVMSHYVPDIGFAIREKHRAAVCYAGEQAVQLVFPEAFASRDIHDYSYPDNVSATNHLIAHLERSGRYVNEQHLSEATYRMLRKYRPLLIDLAEQLFFRRFMEGRQVRSFLRKRLGSLQRGAQ
jgi:hypothetical protein